jgi:hypothetical protein
MEPKKMEPEIPDEHEKDFSQSDMDWDDRILCNDGNCIGVIGPDGLCKECGAKYEGTLPETGDSDKEELSTGEKEVEETDDIEVQSPTSADSASEKETESDDWSARKLCSDGNCIGVIGSDGRCKECGKPSE